MEAVMSAPLAAPAAPAASDTRIDTPPQPPSAAASKASAAANGAAPVKAHDASHGKPAETVVVDDPADAGKDPAEHVLVKASAKRYVAADPDMSDWSHEHQLLFRLVVDILNGAVIARATQPDAPVRQAHAERLREAFCSVRWSRDKISWVTNTIVECMPRAYRRHLLRLYGLLKRHIPAPLHDRLTVPPRKKRRKVERADGTLAAAEDPEDDDEEDGDDNDDHGDDDKAKADDDEIIDVDQP